MRILVIEDEIPAQRMLKEMIKKIRPNWSIATVLDSVDETVRWLNDNDMPDVIFMDIQLSDGISFSIFEHCSVTCSVIFTTAYDEYAIQAFQVNSIDYLLKPIKESDLTRAIEKFEITRNVKPTFDIKDIIAAVKSAEHSYRKRFLVSSGDSYLQIPIAQVAYLYSRNRVTRIVTFEKKEYALESTLEQLELELDPNVFFRVNRQYITNIEAIRKTEQWFHGKLLLKVEPVHDEEITVSRDKAPLFKRWLDW